MSSSTRKKWYQTRLLIQFYTEALNVKLELESALTSAQKYCKQIEAMMIFIDKLQSLISGRRDNLHHRDTSRFVSSRNYSIKYLRNKKKKTSRIDNLPFSRLDNSSPRSDIVQQWAPPGGCFSTLLFTLGWFEMKCTHWVRSPACVRTRGICLKQPDSTHNWGLRFESMFCWPKFAF